MATIKKAELLMALEDEKRKASEYLELLKRSQADFDNFKKRLESDRNQIEKEANKRTIVKLLVMIDNLELALKNAQGDDAFINGVKIVYNQFRLLLETEGVEKIPTDGVFNPELHEAVAVDDSGGNLILEELQSGYRLNGKVLRAAKVRIGAK